MASIRRLSALLFAPLGIAGVVACSATPVDRTHAPDPVVAPLTAECAPGSTEARCATAVIDAPACAEGPTCRGIVSADEQSRLKDDIAAAKSTMLTSQYTDVRAMVTLARLELRRDADLGDQEGANDAERGLRDAMRAVATDGTLGAPRLVLALARARLLFDLKTAVDAETRAGGLEMVMTILRTTPVDNEALAAAAKTLEGYVALERADRVAAKAAFESATKLDPTLGAAWMGLGDAARANGDFDAAAAAYRAGIERLPGDEAAQGSLNAASAKRPISIPRAPLVVMPIDTAPLAAPAPALPKCPSSVKSGDPAWALCEGLVALGRARTKDEVGAAAQAILSGWKVLQPLCQDKDKACGDFVAPAIAAGSRAFRTAGKLAKGVAMANFLLLGSDVSIPPATTSALLLEIGDAYQVHGILNLAADLFEKQLRLSGARTGPVLRRVLAIRLALGQSDLAVSLAENVAADTSAPTPVRATAVIATASLLRAANDSTVSGHWLSRFERLLEEADQKDMIAELSKAIPGKGEPPECASLLRCAVRRIAGHTRWVP